MTTLLDVRPATPDVAGIIGEVVTSDAPPALPCTIFSEAARSDGDACHALWLTQAEAFTLVTLCLTSPSAGGDAEESVLTKLGDCLRGFS